MVGISCAGSGAASTQTAPDSVHPGAPIPIVLKVSLWGSREPSQRVEDVALHYKLKAEANWHQVDALSSSLQKANTALPNNRTAVWMFQVPPYPDTASGKVMFYYFTFRLDGERNDVPGYKSILIR